MKKTKLKEMILSILKTEEKSRNCDQFLTLKIWAKYYPQCIFLTNDGFKAVKLIHILGLPREDNIKRIRAKIQNEEKLFLPTEKKVRKQRKISEENWKDFLQN
jgi:hypothetical protein